MATNRWQDSLTYRPPGSAAGVAADASMQAAQTLGSLRGALTQFAAQRQTLRGGQAGQLAGALAAGKGSALERKSDFTAYGAAFNNAAERSYYASAVTDINGQLDRIEEESGSDPELYNAKVSGLLKGGQKNWDPGMLLALTQYARDRALDGEKRVRHAAGIRVREQQRVDVLEGVESLNDRAVGLYASGDPANFEKANGLTTQIVQMIDGAKADGTLSPMEAHDLSTRVLDNTAKRVTQARVSNATDAISAAYRAGGVRAGDEALAALEHSALPEDERALVRSKVRTNLELLRTERQQEHVNELAGIESAIATETAGMGTLSTAAALYSNATLTPDQYAGYRSRIAGVMKKRAGDEAVSEELTAALSAGLPLDPHNAEHRKAVASAFSNATQGVTPGSQPWQVSALMLANRTRMLPDQALAWIRQTARSPDPMIAAAGASFFGSVQAAVPDAVGAVDSDTKAFVGTINSMVEAGTDPALAVETARMNVFDTKREVVERRKDDYRKLAKDSDAALDRFIDRDFDPGLFRSQPAASAGLKADFASQAERYYEKVGDIALARDLAWKDLKRVYGPSRVNGAPLVMAYPPERFGVTPEDVRTDIGNFLKGNPQADGSTAADVILVPDELTQRAVADSLSGSSVRPSYRMVGKSGDLILDRNGVAKRWTVPSGEELAARLRAAQDLATQRAQQQVEQARFDRQVQEWRRQYFSRGELR